MQNAETVLGVLRDRGRRGLPCNELFRQLFNPQIDLLPFSGLIFVRFIYPSGNLAERGWRGAPGIADGWHAEVGGPGAAVAFDASVEAGEFAFSGFQADLESLVFAEPAVHPCFGDAFAEVVDDLGEQSLLRRNAKHRASQASVLVLARRPVRAPAGSQRHLAQLEVLLEFLPFLVGGLAVFSGGPGGPPLVEERR